MIIKALKTFSDGIISMHEGEIAKVPDAKAQIYIRFGYAIEYTEGGDITETLNTFESTKIAPYYERKSYDTMPTDEDLITILGSNTRVLFETRGYYKTYDGAGGLYCVTTDAVQGARKFVVDNTDYYLVPLDMNFSERVNVCRLGIRPYAKASMADVTIEESYAEINSNYLKNIYKNGTPHDFILSFPAGRFYFKDTIDLTGYEMGIEGVEPARARDEIANSGLFGGGTVLCFPFLDNGDEAIKQGDGKIRNLLLLGSKQNYDFSIDRTKLQTTPNEVVTEVIKANGDASDFTNTGIYKTGSGEISNVYVMHFWRGILARAHNTYVNNVFAKRCHFGFTFGNDIKARGVYGWNVHTLLQVTGAIFSGVQIRVDSCVHAVQITTINGNGGSIGGVTLDDVDGDWCTDSLIKIGNDVNYIEARNCVFSNIHGRCNTLKYYSADNTPPSASTLNTTNSDGYGIIRIGEKATFVNNRVSINTLGDSNVVDSASARLLTPPILLTFGSGGNGVKGNMFTVSAPQIATASDIADILQFGSEGGTSARIDTAFNTYYVKGSTVTPVIAES